MSTKILIVDDEPDVELMMRQRFRRKGLNGHLELRFAHNGSEALAALEQEADIELVVTDINMPVMDGLTFIGRVAGLARPVKVVVVSAYGDMPNIRTAMNRGAFDFVTKPIDFQDLSVTIRKATEELERLKQGLAAQQRLSALQSELQVAARIQQSMLPRTSAVLSGRSDVQVHAEMIAARLVGGDFYDVFPIDPDHLALVIGDVSGKGVPAALFMSAARTLLRATASQQLSPGECVTYVNHVLSRDSDPAMFVTLFYGVLELSTGRVECALGGHQPPIILSRDGSARNAEIPAGLIVGAIDRMKFDTHSLTLAPGDGLLLYTDGVTEAENGRQIEFSEEALLSMLNGANLKPPDAITKDVIAAVRLHAGDAPQSDDITVVALRYLGATSL
jgi:sigma-B regulation protein RsbU (phosphoserine phosphatase)